METAERIKGKSVKREQVSSAGRYQPTIGKKRPSGGANEPADKKPKELGEPLGGAEGRVVGHWQVTTVDHASVVDGAFGGHSTVTDGAERGLWAVCEGSCSTAPTLLRTNPLPFGVYLLISYCL
ncbi:hypothetical protein Taro_031080 [Colocasia esculenta]|uniref:Uncharacterized protein n=1 Tax=Colocasia esculenta TaxID=4460 RepID=A0A843VTN7_COLES|nr:hypothetical protein [Colocasia esculenta]